MKSWKNAVFFVSYIVRSKESDIMPHANHARAYRENTKASRPETGEPVLTREIRECPECHTKSNVRLLEKMRGVQKYFCSGCLKEFEHYRVIIDWTGIELKEVARLWKNGEHLGTMAEKLKRDPDDLAILVISLVKLGKLRKRPGGAYGEPKKLTPAVREMLGANRF